LVGGGFDDGGGGDDDDDDDDGDEGGDEEEDWGVAKGSPTAPCRLRHTKWSRTRLICLQRNLGV
jgi:hypothetical protein